MVVAVVVGKYIVFEVNSFGNCGQPKVVNWLARWLLQVARIKYGV